MKIKPGYIIVFFPLILILFVAWIEFEQKFVVTGRIVDSTTGKPIEGASIAIRWTGHHFLSFYSSGSYDIERAYSTSDKDGYFKIPKYFLRSFYMGVYKKGYVCWSNDYIFLKGGHGKRRYIFWIRPYMTIKLEPMTSEYPRYKHAGFLEAVSSATDGLEGTGEELKYYYDIYWGRNKKNEK